MDGAAGSTSISNTRLYGASIAVVSWVYFGYLAVGGTGMSLGAWFMLALGAVVLVHGIVLLTPAADRLDEARGPLMIVYAVLMLANPVWLVLAGPSNGGMGADGMDSGMGGGIEMAAMTADAGMVAVAVLMLASGVIMIVRRDGSGRGRGGM